jgi:hypothetical protein
MLSFSLSRWWALRPPKLHCMFWGHVLFIGRWLQSVSSSMALSLEVTRMCPVTPRLQARRVRTALVAMRQTRMLVRNPAIMYIDEALMTLQVFQRAYASIPWPVRRVTSFGPQVAQIPRCRIPVVQDIAEAVSLYPWTRAPI